MKREALNTFRCEATRRISGQNRALDAAFTQTTSGELRCNYQGGQINIKTFGEFYVSVYKNSLFDGFQQKLWLCFRLVLKCFLSDAITGGKPRGQSETQPRCI